MGLLVVEQNLGVATSLAERQLIMVTGVIAAETTAAALIADPAAQRRYLGVEPLADAAVAGSPPAYVDVGIAAAHRHVTLASFAVRREPRVPALATDGPHPSMPVLTVRPPTA